MRHDFLDVFQVIERAFLDFRQRGRQLDCQNRSTLLEGIFADCRHALVKFYARRAFVEAFHSHAVFHEHERLLPFAVAALDALCGNILQKVFQPIHILPLRNRSAKRNFSEGWATAERFGLNFNQARRKTHRLQRRIFFKCFDFDYLSAFVDCHRFKFAKVMKLPPADFLYSFGNLNGLQMKAEQERAAFDFRHARRNDDIFYLIVHALF